MHVGAHAVPALAVLRYLDLGRSPQTNTLRKRLKHPYGTRKLGLSLWHMFFSSICTASARPRTVCNKVECCPNNWHASRPFAIFRAPAPNRLQQSGMLSQQLACLAAVCDLSSAGLLDRAVLAVPPVRGAILKLLGFSLVVLERNPSIDYEYCGVQFEFLSHLDLDQTLGFLDNN